MSQCKARGTGWRYKRIFTTNSEIPVTLTAVACAPVDSRWTHFHTPGSLITCSERSWVLQSLMYDAKYRCLGGDDWETNAYIFQPLPLHSLCRTRKQMCAYYSLMRCVFTATDDMVTSHTTWQPTVFPKQLNTNYLPVGGCVHITLQSPVS